CSCALCVGLRRASGFKYFSEWQIRDDHQTITPSSSIPVTHTWSPQPVIMNNQISDSGIITLLVPPDPAGTSLTLLPASYPMLLQGTVINLATPQPSPTAQPFPATLQAAAHPSSATLQPFPLVTPLMPQAMPSSHVTRDVGPPGGTERGSPPHPVSSDPKRQIREIEILFSLLGK
ncbi:hypothetical protein COCON_G00217250, partial [Conger conger]